MNLQFMNNNKLLTLTLALLVIFIIFYLYSKEQRTGEESDKVFDLFNRPPEWQGRYAPDLEIELINGEKFRLSDNVGKKTVILNFFAAWCRPCREEMPELNDYYEKHKAEPFTLIGINADESADRVKDFLKRFGIRFPLGIDRGNKIQTAYTVMGFPTTVFIGADGIVQGYETGKIMNADIAFDAVHKMNMDIIVAGKGIRKEAYLKNLDQQKNLQPDREEKGSR